MDDIKQLILKAQNNDESAREKLVNDNIALVWSLVHRFKNSNYEKEELFQIGCVGLIKAINKITTTFSKNDITLNNIVAIPR